MKVALVYDRVNKFGGAERVLLALHEIWPSAPLFTSVYHPKTAGWAKDFRVIPSLLNKLPFARNHHELFPWLMPLVFEGFEFDEFDVVISITSEFAKGIITKPETLHFCYCLTPTRYLWSGYNSYFRSSVFKFFSSPIISYLKKWDQIASQRVDEYLAISETVQTRIKKYYGRDSTVIYPGINIQKFKSLKVQKQKSNFFLIVSRLVPYKKIDLAVKAFNQLGWPLKIIGTGSELRKLKKIAESNIEFLDQLTDKELIGYYQNCHALIMPQDEDFGLVCLEAQAVGRPVIAYKGGGALETVIKDKTGIFFEEQTVDSLIKGLKEFKSLKLKPEDCQQQAKKFNVKIFKREFKNFIENQWQKHRKKLKLK